MKINRIFITAAILSVAMTASCGKKVSQSDMNDAKEEVNQLLGDVTSNAVDSAVSYIDENGADIKEEIKNSVGMSDVIEGAAVLAQEYLDSDAVDEIVSEAMDKVMDRVSYTINSAEQDPEDPKRVIVDATITAPSSNGISIDDIDYMSLISQCFGNMSYEDLAKLVMERTGLSAAELKAAYGSGDQAVIEKVMAAFAPEIKSFSGKAVDEILDKTDTEEKDTEFILEKQDGNWKIVDTNGF
jgi:hypothetical protein